MAAPGPVTPAGLSSAWSPPLGHPGLDQTCSDIQNSATSTRPAPLGHSGWIIPSLATPGPVNPGWVIPSSVTSTQPPRLDQTRLGCPQIGHLQLGSPCSDIPNSGHLHSASPGGSNPCGLTPARPPPAWSPLLGHPGLGQPGPASPSGSILAWSPTQSLGWIIPSSATPGPATPGWINPISATGSQSVPLRSPRSIIILLLWSIPSPLFPFWFLFFPLSYCYFPSRLLLFPLKSWNKNSLSPALPSSSSPNSRPAHL